MYAQYSIHYSWIAFRVLAQKIRHMAKKKTAMNKFIECLVNNGREWKIHPIAYEYYISKTMKEKMLWYFGIRIPADWLFLSPCLASPHWLHLNDNFGLKRNPNSNLNYFYEWFFYEIIIRLLTKLSIGSIQMRIEYNIVKSYSTSLFNFCYLSFILFHEINGAPLFLTVSIVWYLHEKLFLFISQMVSNDFLT